MKGHHDVYVMEGGGGYRVRPAVWSINPKKAGSTKALELLIRNFTPFKVIFAFPDIVDTAQPPGTADVILQPKGATDSAGKAADTCGVTLKAAANPGAYTYSVVVLTDKGPIAATGESEPVVIIDPPS
jgi:hypothetical protein